MQTDQRLKRFLQLRNVVRFLVKSGLVTAIGLLVLATMLSMEVDEAQAHPINRCSAQEQIYIVKRGDTLGKIATRHRINWKRLMSRNHLNNPNLLHPKQRLCIPSLKDGNGKTNTKTKTLTRSADIQESRSPVSRYDAAIGHRNPFPYGQCTWWASQRYNQLHGAHIPWGKRADAWEWTARAQEYGWQVTARPTKGAIIDLQPWVQGARGSGHVGVVERVDRNGDVIVSSMNWGRNPWAVTYWRFTPGPGVTFIHRY